MRLVSAVLVMTTALLPVVSTGIADAPGPPPPAVAARADAAAPPAATRAVATAPLPAPRPVVRRAPRALSDHDVALGVLLLLAAQGRRTSAAP
jgi:hypothetical protein